MDSEDKKEKEEEKEEMEQQKKYIKNRKKMIESEENENSLIDVNESVGVRGGFDHKD